MKLIRNILKPWLPLAVACAACCRMLALVQVPAPQWLQDLPRGLSRCRDYNCSLAALIIPGW